MNNQKKKETKGGINSVAAVITGAIVGAGVIAAGVVVLSDKKNREKVKDVLTKAKDKTVDGVENLQKQAQKKISKITTKLAADKEKVIDAANTKIDLMQNQVK